VLARLGWLGGDYANVMEFGRRWWEHGSMYLPFQLIGPFDPFHMSAPVGSLYPPVVGPLFAAWNLVPWPLWWITPLAIVGYALVRWRPAAWSWPIMAAVLALPETPTIILTGGTSLWTSAFVAAGLLWRWPFALLLLKPSLLPLAFLGVRDPRWWLVSCVLLVASLPRLDEYLSVVWNGSLPWWYSWGAGFMASAILVAWWSGVDGRDGRVWYSRYTTRALTTTPAR
jgi:hypothetical protein